MGNRAVITTGKNSNAPAIYLHWNGGVESVLAFLEAAKGYGVRGANDPTYCTSRLAQIIGNFFGGTTSLGTGPLCQMDVDNYDNGAYLINENFEIVERFGEGSNGIKTVEQLDACDREYYEGVLNQTKEYNDPIFNRR